MRWPKDFFHEIKREFNISKIFTGYHGTSEERANSIIKSSFIPSENHDDWLGYDVYFFIEGISCPLSNAKEWAINQSWDKKNKRNKYKIYSIIEARLTISEAKLLDLTTKEGLEGFNKVRDHIISKYNHFFQRGRDTADDDQKICNMTIKIMCLEALISNLYIKNKVQRTKIINSNIPNVTVMLVVKPKTCIDLSSIKQVETGEIK